MENRITSLFGIKYPIIQAGMIWTAGWKLASAVSNAGGLGLIGSGSMYPEVLKSHIKKCRESTPFSFGVNIPLIYKGIEKQIRIVIEEKVPIVFTSAGDPSKWTKELKKEGIKVAHVISNTKYANKCQEAGVDAIVAEGFEAGGHNGREETTTLCLLPLIKKSSSVPIIAAGGIASGRAMMAAFALGADAVQIGTRFVETLEASSHENFKKVILNSPEGSTRLQLKKLVPVRLFKNKFSDIIKELEDKGAEKTILMEFLGQGRAKRGMFEGDLEEGELEIGQVCSQINSILPASRVIKEIWEEFCSIQKEITSWDWMN